MAPDPRRYSGRNASGSATSLDRRGRGTSPTARALLALELVQASPGITADRLGERLGVSDRAARRYIAILREAGVPIESVRGPYGGYRVGRGLRLPPLMFTATEALGLVMAVVEAHGVPEADDPVGSAVGKLVRVLPENVAGHLVALRHVSARRTDPDPPTAGDHRHPGPGIVRPATGPDRLPPRPRPQSGPGGRPVGGRRTPRPLVPARLVARRRCAAASTASTGSAPSRCSTRPSPRRRTSTRCATSRTSCHRAGRTPPRSRSTRPSTRSGSGCHAAWVGSR